MQWQVRLDGVTAGYPNRAVLDQLTMQIPALTTTAVVGPNGSGKSTLLGVIAGVIRVTAGKVEHGTDKRVAYVTQRSNVADVLPLTVRDAVSMGRWGHRGLWRRLTRRDQDVVESSMKPARHQLPRPSATGRAVGRPAPARLRRARSGPGGRSAPARRARHRPRRDGPAAHRRCAGRGGGGGADGRPGDP